MTALQNRERVATEIDNLHQVHFFQFMRCVAPRLMRMSDAEHAAVMAMQADGDRLGEVAKALRHNEITIEAAQAEAKRLMTALPEFDEESLSDLAHLRAISDRLAGVEAVDPEVRDSDEAAADG